MKVFVPALAVLLLVTGCSQPVARQPEGVTFVQAVTQEGEAERGAAIYDGQVFLCQPAFKRIGVDVFADPTLMNTYEVHDELDQNSVLKIEDRGPLAKTEQCYSSTVAIRMLSYIYPGKKVGLDQETGRVVIVLQ